MLSVIYYLSDSPADDERGVLGVGKHSSGSVIEAEVGGSVDDDTLDWYSEATVQTAQAIGFEDFGQAVTQTAEFTFASGLAYVSGQPMQENNRKLS